jgi:hypothetical protein
MPGWIRGWRSRREPEAEQRDELVRLRPVSDVEDEDDVARGDERPSARSG